MKKIIPIIVIIITAVLALVLRDSNNKETSVSTPSTAKEPQGELTVGTRIGNLAPDFELKDYNGKTVRLSDFRGQKPVFINFWATWCPFCVEELPLMARVQKQSGDQYVTLAINRGEDQKTGRKFTDQLGLADAFVLLNDKSDSTYGRYGGFAMPHSVFIDREGVIQDMKLGPLTEAELIQKINKIIK
ncbi:MAG: TlpA family protein disulfide reductase [Candidatus Yanofskybacteria bacterium]|nr:TlpA family protein disulfide reductase [Candidatus Yanofskybacteria bacterium]